MPFMYCAWKRDISLEIMFHKLCYQLQHLRFVYRRAAIAINPRQFSIGTPFPVCTLCAPIPIND